MREARARRDEARKLLEEGIDPSAARQAQKATRLAQAENTVKNVAQAWLKHRSSGWKENTTTMITGTLEMHVYPAIGSKPVADIVPADIRNIVQAIEATGAVEIASRTFQRLRAIFRYAVAHELIAVDPTYPLKAAEILKPRQVTHRASMPAKEAPAFLRKLDAYGGDPTTQHALRLLILTATRPGEVRGAQWDEIERENMVWRIPAERMKMGTEHIVPLSKQALAVLDEMQPLSGHGTLVFPSPFYPGKALSETL